MIISKKRFAEKIRETKEQIYIEEMEKRNNEERIRYLHERIDRLERMVYELQGSVGKQEETVNEWNSCTPVRG